MHGDPFEWRVVSRAATLVFAFVLLLAVQRSADAHVDESFLRDLPPGIFMQSSTQASVQQLQTIGARLGAKIERISNSVVTVHGRQIQVNSITAVDEAGAKAIFDTLSKTKPYPFCLRNERRVIEYVGKDVDAALAMKTSYELGFLEKPRNVRYKVTAELATIERADAMDCNLLFNDFLALNGSDSEAASVRIDELSKKCIFGKSLVMRDPKNSEEITPRTFQPSASKETSAGPTVRYSFEKLNSRQGVPFVTVTMELAVDDTGMSNDSAVPSSSLVAATPAWPADNPQIAALAAEITNGKITDDAKVAAILHWLTPGKNIKYGGQTGSRWGTAKVLQQKLGQCWDFSDCFVTLCRAANVPSRQVAGWLYGVSGHVWAEFYVQGKGWQQVDPTGGGNTEMRHLSHCIFHISGR